jgi:hypothetical protein
MKWSADVAHTSVKWQISAQTFLKIVSEESTQKNGR